MHSTLHVEVKEPLGEINPNIYGHFTEHLGSCVYGGIWAAGGFPGDIRDGIRQDTLSLIQGIKPPVIRWPGGCFSEFYHWEDGIGPPETRPVTYDWMWEKPEPNRVGTHEFMDLCRLSGARPVLAANVRTGSPDEAARWVAYCNQPPHTPEGQRRALNGSPSPFSVRYWDIGNEGWDLTATAYAHRVLEYANAMKAEDPSIRLIAVGGSGSDMAWNEEVLRIAGSAFHFIAPHHYTGLPARDEEDDSTFYNNTACAHLIEETLLNTASLLDRLFPAGDGPAIALDEWGVWWQNNHGLRHNYDVSDAILAASVFCAMHRLPKRVQMANWAQLVNCLGIIQTDDIHACATPVYLVYKLLTRFQTRSVACTIEAPEIPVDASVGIRRPVLALDASASVSSDGRTLTVLIACRSRREEVRLSLQTPGFTTAAARIGWLRASGPFILNTTASPECCRIVTSPLNDAGFLVIPPHTVALIEMES